MKIEAHEVERRVETFKAAVQEAGLKLTHQRLEVFRELASSADHPDAHGIYDSVKHRLPTVSLDTVYRTLRTLSDLGLINMLGTAGESIRFDANTRKHHHFVCVNCGLVRDFENEELSALQVQEDLVGFGRVLETQIEVRGICNDCRNKS
ncbi:transcriptional repressor [bacterium]|nr:transcriptional repressor [bacterium]